MSFWDSDDELHAGDVFKGLLAGLAGGLVGTWVMTQFQTRLGQAFSSDDESGESQDEESDEPATARAAEMLSTAVADRRLTKHEKEIAGPLMHYGFGTTMGGIYGAVAEALPIATAGRGTLFGAALWAAADEAAVPALGLSDPPTQTPASTHVHGLISHLVYGLATDTARRLFRSLL